MASQTRHTSSAADRDVKLGRALVRELASHGGFLSVDEQRWKKFYMRVFGRHPSGRMRDYFHRFPHVFSCEPDDDVPDSVIIRSKASIELCSEHCSKDGCHKLGCEGLHCCKFFLRGTCKFDQKCRHGHNLMHPHNLKLLARYYLDGLSPKEIGAFMKCGSSKRAFPTACKFYNNEGGCDKGDRGEKCPHLHVCQHYLQDDCKFGRKCKRSHNIYDSQPKKILAKYGIRIDRSPKDVLEELRAAMPTGSKMDDSRTDSETDASDDSDEELGAVGPAPLSSRRRTSSSSSAARESTEICTYFLWKKCNYGKSCANLHPRFPLPYQWQFKVDGEWRDFARDKNDEIEVVFCDPKNRECFIADAGPNFEGAIAINFDTMVCMQQNQDTYAVRRLSTRASKGQSSTHLYLTEWCWYWNDTRKEQWIEFGRDEDITSEDLEEAFALNPNGHISFRSNNGAAFVADLEAMKRTNKLSGSEISIRRRPLLFDPKTKQPGRKRHCESSPSKPDLSGSKLGTIYPETWNLEFRSDNDFFQIVPVQPGSSEFSDVDKLFKASMPGHSLRSIRRIQNAELWDGFYRKKTWMEKKLKTGSRLDVRQLFHGTKGLYIDAICQQGFDWRMCGSSVGTKYGKGSYFARDASYSQSYTDCRKMFLVRVLVGEYALGSSVMVRPPPKDTRQPYGELYDSVVNVLGDPSIFVIFTQEQAYPEYLLEY